MRYKWNVIICIIWALLISETTVNLVQDNFITKPGIMAKSTWLNHWKSICALLIKWIKDSCDPFFCRDLFYPAFLCKLSHISFRLKLETVTMILLNDYCSYLHTTNLLSNCPLLLGLLLLELLLWPFHPRASTSHFGILIWHEQYTVHWWVLGLFAGITYLGTF